MGSFFKMFFASLVALVIFSLVCFFLFITLLSGLARGSKPKVARNSVLVLNLGQIYGEQPDENPLGRLVNEDEDVPGLYDVVRLIKHAASDKEIKGIYVLAGMNMNGFAGLEEIRNELINFRNSGKFILAYGEVMDQKSYYVSTAADSIYVNPKGYFDWGGFSAQLMFLKGTLEKLDIEPQIFYAGKFKSATEPFRTDRMTDENKLQTSAWLNELYAHFLLRSGERRKIDTAELHRLANEAVIQTPLDAVNNRLIDGVKYDDEIREEIKRKLGLTKTDKINFIAINTYAEAADFRDNSGDRIALIYAHGTIIDGNAQPGMIGSSNYTKLIRRARLDKSIKAIVFRVNSGGGSALASESIWRELSLAKKEKPVVVSFGDVAASGGYYISCAADSIFASPNTITGSIGVFGIIPNMQDFFKNKLGVTFDGVKTAPHADAGAIYRPMTEKEKQIAQRSVDNIYESFKQRVAEGRKKSVVYVDSIAQGRVWSGEAAIKIGLIDKFGGLHDAVECAARMAKLRNYRLREYPEIQTLLERILGEPDRTIRNEMLKKELGDEQFRIYNEMLRVREMTNSVQARIPFEFQIR